MKTKVSASSVQCASYRLSGAYNYFKMYFRSTRNTFLFIINEQQIRAIVAVWFFGSAVEATSLYGNITDISTKFTVENPEYNTEILHIRTSQIYPDISIIPAFDSLNKIEYYKET